MVGMWVVTVSAFLFLSGCISTENETRPSDSQFDGVPVPVSVCGANPMNSTGIHALRGQRWFIEVIGSDTACEDGKHPSSNLRKCDEPECAFWKDGRQPPSPPEGYELWYLKPAAFLKRVRSARWYELSGSIGPDLHQTFVVGRYHTVLVEGDGEIFLFANDAACRYDNNYGSLRVRLVRLK
jgi:hypothetical protein